MSSFPTVMKHLVASGPLTPQQQDLVLDMLPTVDEVSADTVLTELVRHTPAEHWTMRLACALRRAQTPTLRGTGWYGTGQSHLPFTLEEWESAALAENNRHVRRELITIAPTRASRAAVLALVNVDTIGLDPTPADEAALTSERTFFAYDMLEHMPAHTGWACTELLPSADPKMADITKAGAALRTCDPVAGAGDSRVPALFRIRLAARPSVPAGVMTQVVTELAKDWTAIAELSATMTAVTHLRTAFHEMLDVPLGTGEDRAALLQFTTNVDVSGRPEPDQVEHHNELLNLERHGTPADVVLCAMKRGAAVVHRPDRMRALWHRLPEDQRTDDVCAAALTATEAMGDLVVAHLGERAREVLEANNLFEYGLGRDVAPTWMRDLDRKRWIGEVRREASEARVSTLLSIDPDDEDDEDDEAADEVTGGPNWQALVSREAIVEDLKRDYLDWPTASAIRVLNHLDDERRADVLAHVPATIVALWASAGSTDAAQALWTALAAAVAADDQVSGDANATRVEPTRAAAVAAMLSGNTVALPALQSAQHI